MTRALSASPGPDVRRSTVIMPVFRLAPEPIFPPPNLAEPDGLWRWAATFPPSVSWPPIARASFPGTRPAAPILWWSPDPRLVLFCDELHISRRLDRTIRQGRFETRYDTAFAEVIRGCASTPRADEDGTWITREMREAYIRLHQQGHAHCMESCAAGELVGGIYGVRVGRCFCGESMFHRETDASKVALAALVVRLESRRRRSDRLPGCQRALEELRRAGDLAPSLPRTLKSRPGARSLRPDLDIPIGSSPVALAMWLPPTQSPFRLARKPAVRDPEIPGFSSTPASWAAYHAQDHSDVHRTGSASRSGAKLTRLQTLLEPQVPAARWTRTEPFHLTLAFLGDVHDTDLHKVCKAVA